MNAEELCQNIKHALNTRGGGAAWGGGVLRGGPRATVQGAGTSPAKAELSSGCFHPFPQPCLPPPALPRSGGQALLRLGVRVPGAGAEGVGASLLSGSELEHSNYAGGFMSLCL